MGATQTARERARAEITAEILTAARRHLADDGPAGLSLRAVARELGMAPSAIYRYFENRDALLTAMIVEAYDALGERAETAAAAVSSATPRSRWVAVASAIRSWALANRHEYGLLYGTPVPGYAAPEDTVVPGTRVSLALVRVVADAYADGRVAIDRDDADDERRLEEALGDELDDLATRLGHDLPPEVVFRTVVAWTQLFGLLSFELFSQTRGIVTEHERLFVAATDTMAARIGLIDQLR